jgi:hypothetical protein
MHARTVELLAYLDLQREVLRAAFHDVPPELREHSPGLGRWSPAAIVEHLAILQPRLAGILTMRITEARAAGVGPETSFSPLLPTFDLDKVVDRTTRVQAPDTGQPKGLTASAAWEALERGTPLIREALVSGSDLALNEVMHPHPRFGPLSIYNWVAFVGAHEARHAAQIRELLAETTGRT